MGFLENFFSSEYMPHGHCYFWDPGIVWANAISDSIIAIAYMTIPMTLLFIFRRRRDFSYIWMMALFAVFILGCGMTHVFDVINIWTPYYRTDSFIRIVTALASIGTAIMLIKITPKVILIPSAAEWKRVNDELTSQINELKEKDKTIESFKHFEYLAETLPQLVWLNSPEGKPTFFNKRWYNYTGLTIGEDLEELLTKIIYPKHLENTLSLWRTSLITGGLFESEICIRNSKGEYRWHLGRALPVKSSDLIIMWVCTLTDIHDQKNYQKELKDKNEELTKINNDLDNFVYTASHDLKSPISNMEGLLYALEEPQNDEQTIKSLLKSSVKKLNSTINDLAEIAKVQKDIYGLKEVINLKDIIYDAMEGLSEEISKSGSKIKLDLQIDNIEYSRKNFRSIVYNLLSNAIKYRSPNRPSEILIKTEKNENYIILTIQDNGIGFDISQKNKIFSMFRRLHDHIEGTGLGLYIVNRIVENERGKIEVESEIDKGTTFRVYFFIK